MDMDARSIVKAAEAKNTTQKPQRWYDAQPKVKRIIDTLQHFPHEVLSIVAEGAVTMAERECRALEMMKSIKSLGTEKVLAMYKSKNKRRAYDSNPEMHKAVNYMFILSEQNRDYLADKTLDLIECVTDYLKACRELECEPKEADISDITQTYVSKGAKDAKAFIYELRNKFLKQVVQRPTQTLSTGRSGEAIRARSQDMRLGSNPPL
jgi:hypothetical protein